MKVKDSPIRLPLTVVDHNWSDTSIYDADGKIVARFSISDEATEDTQSQLEAEQSEKVKFIIMAVNSYVGMRAVLVSINKFWADCAENAGKGGANGACLSPSAMIMDNEQTIAESVARACE